MCITLNIVTKAMIWKSTSYAKNYTYKLKTTSFKKKKEKL